jgi:small subunit ribosomal protein S8e
MAIWQAESKRKPSGGRLIAAHKKRKFEIGRETQPATLGEPKRKAVRIRGGHTRVRIITSNVVVVTDPKTGKAQKADIVPPGVVTNAANPHYVRRNIMTKGAIVKTSLGLARITSRPGQDGTINGVLVDGAK